MSAVSAVLLSWQRPENFRRILPPLFGWAALRDVVIWNNNPDVSFKREAVTANECVTVINSGENFMFLPRYLIVPLLRGDVVLFLDDDVVMQPEQLERVYSALKSNPYRLYGPRGRKLNEAQTALVQGIEYGEVDAICGMCSMFTKELYYKAWPEMMKYLLSKDAMPSALVEDDVAFSFATTLVTGEKPFAVNVEPIEGIKNLKPTTHRALWPQYEAGRKRAVEHFKK